ncbi:MAG: hypothetical protein AB2556_16955 [Candidatus Thiodiazotropha sp.]
MPHLSNPPRQGNPRPPRDGIVPAQWRDKGVQLYLLLWHAVYLPDPEYVSQVKDVPDSTAPRYDDPLTRHQLSYLNGGGGSGKTTRAIEFFRQKNPCLHPNPSPSQRDAGQRGEGPNLPLVLPLEWPD